MLQHLLLWSSLSLASRFAGPSATSADANDRQSKSCQHFILPFMFISIFFLPSHRTYRFMTADRPWSVNGEGPTKWEG